MKLKSVLFLSVMALVSASAAHAADSDEKAKTAVMKFVPEAKVIKQDGHEFDLQTSAGTIVEVEVNRDGSIDEASGDSATKGDALVPGQGLISLKDAVAALSKANKSPTGDWSLEKSMMNGWVYEFEGVENGKNMEYGVSAKDGKIVKDNRDIL